MEHELKVARFIREDCYSSPQLLSDVILRNEVMWSGAEHGVDGQVEWCDHLVNYRKLVIVTGHSLGKSWWLSHVAIPWYLLTRPNALVLIYVPSYNLAVGQLWAGILAALKGGPTHDNKWRQPAINIVHHPKIGGIGNPTIILPGNGSQVMAMSSDKPEKLQGQRRPHTMIVSDESSGLMDVHWKSMMSIGAEKMIHTGNPLSRSTEFYQQYLLGNESVGPARNGIKTIQLSSLQSPDAELDRSSRGLASKSIIDDYKNRYGESSPEYRCRVLAHWPTDSYEDLFSPRTLDMSSSAIAREKAEAWRKLTPAHDNPRILAIDPGEGTGDSSTVICIRDNFGILRMESAQLTVAEAASRVQYLMAEYSITMQSNVVYDRGGTTGTDLQAELHKLYILHAQPYCGGNNSAGGVSYSNIRSACAFAMAYRMTRSLEENPFHIPGDLHCFPELIEELRELRSAAQGDSKSALENRNFMKDRLKGGRSPDHADALSMTFLPEALKRAR